MKLTFTLIVCICLPQFVMGQNIVANEVMDTLPLQKGFDSVVEEGFPEDITEEQAYSPFLFQNSNDFFLSSLSEMLLWDFKPRGVSVHKRRIQINGIEWNHPETGAVSFNDLSALYGNSHTEAAAGLNVSSISNGGMNGMSSFTINPLLQRKSYRAGYLFSNENTKHTLRLHYASGLSKNGWATNIGFTQKWSNEGYVPGTFIRSGAFLVALGKKISKKGALTLSVFGNTVQRAYSADLTKETAVLARDFQYNPNWGLQSGKKRNENTLTVIQPAAILHYRYRPNATTTMNIAFSYQSGIEGYTTLDWFHAHNPIPDYYKNLPSYYYLQGGSQNFQIGKYLETQWQEHPFQLDWPAFYNANRVNAYDASTGIEQPALYVLSEDKSSSRIWRGAIQWKHTFKEHILVSVGTQYTYSIAENYRELIDLLGGNFYINLNQFAFQSYGQASGWEQYDLIHPNRKVYQGEKYFYDYSSQAQKGSLWGNGIIHLGHLHAFLAADMTATGYKRIGRYQNGIFPKASYGASSSPVFLSFQGKAGVEYRFRTGNKLWLRFMTGREDPNFNQTFFNPRILNTQTENLRQPTFHGMEIGWQIKNKDGYAELTLFSSEIKNQTDILQFYHDDYRTYVHLILQGINTAQTGIELAGSFAPVSFLTIDCIAAWTQSFYRSRPQITLVRDNDTAQIFSRQTVYWKNRYAISGPQSVLGLKLHFHSPQLGFLNIFGTLQDRNFVSLNPLRYTEKAVYLLPEGNSRRKLILEQEKLPACFLLHLALGHEFRFAHSSHRFFRKSKWRLSGGIRNLLNHTGYARFGSEQLRFDFDTQNPGVFPNKYVFGFGRTFYLSLKYYGW